MTTPQVLFPPAARLLHVNPPETVAGVGLSSEPAVPRAPSVPRPQQ